MSDVAAPTSPGGAPSTPAPAPSSGSPSTGSSTSTQSRSTPASASPTGQPAKPSLREQAAPKPGESKGPTGETEAQKEVRRQKYKFKVDGQEVEHEWDENEVRTRLQKSLAAEKRMQEAREKMKKWEAATSYLKERPDEALKELAGLDIRKWAEEDLARRYEEALLPEHEREKRDLQRKIEGYEREKKAAEEKVRAQKQKEHFDQVHKETETEFLQALGDLGYEPEVNKALLPIMADLADANLDFGIELSPQQLAAETRKRAGAITQNVVRGMKGQGLLEFLGDSVVREVLRAKLDAHKLAPSEPAAPPPEPVVSNDRPARMTPTEFRKRHILGLK
jgi:hypothetical protein